MIDAAVSPSSPRSIYQDIVALWPRKYQSDGAFEVTAGGNDLAQLFSQVTIRIDRRAVDWTDSSILDLLPQSVRAELDASGGTEG